MSLFYQTVGRVQFRDTDAAGIVHYTSFFNWMEQAEHEMLRRLDWSVVRRGEEFDLSWPRGKVGCEFRRPFKFQQVFGLQVHLSSVGNSSVNFEFQFLHPDDLAQLFPEILSGDLSRFAGEDCWAQQLPVSSLGRSLDDSFRATDRGRVSDQSWFSGERKPAAFGNITSICCQIVHGRPPKSCPIPQPLRDRLLEFVFTTND